MIVLIMHAYSHRRNNNLNKKQHSASELIFLYLSLWIKLKLYKKFLKIYINFKRGPRELKKYEIKYFNLKEIQFTQNQSGDLSDNLRTFYCVQNVYLV